MTTKTKTVDVERLGDICQEIKGLVQEAQRIVRATPEYDRAKGYWIASILISLDSDHGYLGGSMCTMQDTINALNGEDDDAVGRMMGENR